MASKGLRIIAFPCNHFKLQEPGTNAELLNGIRFVRPGNGYEPHANIEFFQKVDINGVNETALYAWLKSSCPPPTTLIGTRVYLHYDPVKVGDITWNFEKFLIDRRGNVRFRFDPENWNDGGNVVPKLNCLLTESASINAQTLC